MNPPGPSEPLPVASLSDQGLTHLARARFWARVTGLAIIGWTSLLSLGTILLGVSMSRQGARLSYAVAAALGTLIVPSLPAVLVLVYAANLARFGRGRPGALVSAFRNLRGLWVVTTLAYAALLFNVLRSFGR